jgi:DNA replication protein DnaC
MKEPVFDDAKYSVLERFKSELSSKMEFERVVRMVAANIPEAYIREIMAGGFVDKKVYYFDPYESEILEDVWPKLVQYIIDPQKMREKKVDLLFFGANGSGKTFEALRLLAAATRSSSCYYIYLRDLYTLYNEVNFKDPTREQIQTLDYITTCDYLVIDEVGKESLSAPLISYMETLLKYRAGAMKRTVICSNIDASKKELLTRYGNSVWDVVASGYLMFQFSAKGNFRKQFRVEL